MKTRFSTIDIVASIAELNKRILHMRLINVYDIDQKTYLFKFSRQEEKAVLLIESGNRLHITEYEWPKNPAPSGFTMKLRKHIHNKRIEQITQLGVDRIVDLQFGSNEAAYHIILELYDKGNIILADYEYTILNLLRPRTEGENIKFMVRETYPVDHAKQHETGINGERLHEILCTAKDGDNLRKVLNPHLKYGPALIDHVLLGVNIPDGGRIGKAFQISEVIPKLLIAFEEAEAIMTTALEGGCKGYITQKEEKRPKQEGTTDVYLAYNEFHPFLFRQHEQGSCLEFPSFNKAIDDFFSKLESQKLDMKAIHQEKEAMKKLDNVKKDHVNRIEALQKAQETDKVKAELIEVNLDLVEKAILVIQSAIANQLDWKEISALIQEATQQADPVARAIKGLKLEMNHITMLLSNPFDSEINVGDDENENENRKNKMKTKTRQDKPLLIDIDLDLSAYANAKKYYDKKRHSAKKEQKTVESSTKAFKSAERKTKQTLKEVATVASINKARKTFWFEKFLWFISSENYLVIGGHDQQQNEIVVKRYLRPGDVYVHADLHGASSIIIKNATGLPVPPKTLNEAGTMAVCSSAAWDSKVVTSAWWVYHDQVSKTAPTGEYLTTGSFMVRGKKNYLPPCYLIMGFGFLFKLDEESIPNHNDERKVKTADEDLGVSFSEASSELADNDVDIPLDDVSSSESDGEDGKEDGIKKENEILETIPEIDGNSLKPSSKSKTRLDDVPDKDGRISEEEEEDGQVSIFPDTVVDLEHFHGDQFLIRPKTQSEIASNSGFQPESVVYLGDTQPVLVKPQESTIKSKKKQMSQSKSCEMTKESLTIVDEDDCDSASESDKKQGEMSQSLQPKRGQKFKMKKMKAKYKDQDDEERQLAMALLQSAGNKPEKKGKKEGKSCLAPAKLPGKKKQARKVQPFLQPTQSKPEGESEVAIIGDGQSVETKKPKENKEHGDDQGSDEEREANQQAAEDANVLNSLTGIPFPDDVLLFAVPVCGPYNAILNYKFKVKLTPGTGKRGKASKMALNMFLHDKMATAREKDLFKSVKDQDVSRNLPGKVKLSAPQLMKSKHK